MQDQERTGPESVAGGGSVGGFVPLGELRATAADDLDLEAIRKRLAGSRGREYWRSLEEVAETDAFKRYLEREFPNQAPRDWMPLGRREFLRVMGATLALAGVGGCGYQPEEKIVPYIEQPEQIVPGKPLFYATAFPRNGYAQGVLGETHMGRPVKLEGNPAHPASVGSTDHLTQGALLMMYDPDRSQTPRYMGETATWDTFVGQMSEPLRQLRQNGGAGLRIVTGTVTSPTLAAQLRRLLAVYPQAKVYTHDPVGRTNVLDGARMAFGTDANPVYHFDRARRILSLDSNFLQDEPASVRYAREFIDGRRVRKDRLEMNRLYVVESTPTITGSNADHQLRVRPSDVEKVARAVAAGLGVAGVTASGTPAGVPAEWITAVVDDLKANPGASLVVAGPGQPPIVHALAFAINDALGATGRTVTYTDPVEYRFGPDSGNLKALADEINNGQVQTIVFLSTNPVYTAGADLGFDQLLLNRVANRIHFGLYDDETGVLCQWHLPESHFLEGWSDARAYDGTASIIQPLIRPLYSTRTAHELIHMLTVGEDRSSFDLVREHWMRGDARAAIAAGFRPVTGAAATAAAGGRRAGTTGMVGGVAGTQQAAPTEAAERFWHSVLVSGVVPGTAAPARNVAVRGGFAGEAPADETSALEIVFRPDPNVWDGTFANIGWLQELPKPLNTTVWDNAAYVSPRTAKEQGLKNGDVVRLGLQGKSVDAAIWIWPGHADNTVTFTLGYGRSRVGKIGNGMGFNAYAIRPSAGAWYSTGLEMKRTGRHYKLVGTQHHFLMENRHLVRVGSLDEYRAHPEAPPFVTEGEHTPKQLPSLYRDMWPSDESSRISTRRPGGGEESQKGSQEGIHDGGAEAGQETHHAGDGPGVGNWDTKGWGRAYGGNPIPAWGMVIDLNACIGCNTCTIACQAENNIATVGKDQVDMNREMHWIRVDSYHTGTPDDPESVFQPVPCMHCENAPCEPVCPVEATSHSAEGLNEMTYNRCIGTRYCSNNCPYKVRRFNFLQYSDMKTPVIQLMRNPDVTTRARGVMEKCTYCVQRINQARMEAEKEDRRIRDLEVIPACAQACPTRAIIFGDLNDSLSNNGKGSQVRQLRYEPLSYSLLSELNTHPRTTYLAKLRNPNPALAHTSAVTAGATERH